MIRGMSLEEFKASLTRDLFDRSFRFDVPRRFVAGLLATELCSKGTFGLSDAFEALPNAVLRLAWTEQLTTIAIFARVVVALFLLQPFRCESSISNILGRKFQEKENFKKMNQRNKHCKTKKFTETSIVRLKNHRNERCKTRKFTKREFKKDNSQRQRAL